MEKNKKLYDNLINSNQVTVDEIGDFNTFNTMLGDSTNAIKLHKNLSNRFSPEEIGDRDTFLSSLDPIGGKAKADTPIVEKDMPDAKPLYAEKKSGVGRYLAKSLEKGTSDLGKMMSDAPAFLYDLASQPTNALFQLIGKPEWQASAKGIGKTLGIENKISSYYDKNSKQIESEIKEIHDGYQKGIIDSFKKGDIESGLMNLAGGLLESLPASMAVMMSGGALGAGAGTVGVGTTIFGAGKRGELEEAAPEMDEGKKLLLSVTNGAIEGLFETAFGSGAMGKAMKNIVTRSSSGKVAQQSVKKFVDNTFVRLIEKTPALAPLGEGFEEVGTQIAQNFTDKYSGYRPDIGIMDGVGDALVMGVAMGGMMTGPLQAAKFVADKRNAEGVIQENIEILTNTDGSVHSAFDRDGNPIFIKSETPGGSAVVVDQDGKSRQIDVADIESRQIISPEDMFASQLAQFEEESQVEQEPTTFKLEGKKYLFNEEITTKDGTLIASEVDEQGNFIGEPAQVDEEGNVTGDFIEVDQETQQRIESQLEAEPEVEPEVWNFEVGGKEYSLKKADDAYVSDPYNNLEAAEKAKEDIEKTHGEQNTIEIVKHKSDDHRIPNSFQIVVKEKVSDELTPEIQEQKEEIEAVSYKIGEKEVSRDYVEDFIDLADTVEELEGLSVSNDPEIDAMIEKKFPKPVTSYKIGKKEVTPERAKARIELAKTRDQLEKLVVSNDADVQALYDERISEFEDAEIKELGEEDKKHNRLVQLMQTYNQSTRPQQGRFDIQSLMKLSSELDYNVKKERDKIVITKKGNTIRTKTIREPKSKIEKHKALTDYDESYQATANNLLKDFHLDGVDVGMMPKEVEQATLDIIGGKKTVGANTLLDALEEIQNTGVVRIKSDRKTGFDGTDLSLDDYNALIDETITPEDKVIMQNIPDEVWEEMDKAEELNDYLKYLPDEARTEEEIVPKVEASKEVAEPKKEITDEKPVEKGREERQPDIIPAEKERREEVVAEQVEVQPKAELPDVDKSELKKEVYEMSAMSKEYADITYDELTKKVFGFKESDIKTISPDKLNVRWKDDFENAKYKQEQSGLSKEEWAKTVNLTEPIQLSYEGGEFYIEDGHHRYYAASILNKELNVDAVEFKDKPHITAIKNAISEGKTVPKEVLAEYPELVKGKKPTTKTAYSSFAKSIGATEDMADILEGETLRAEIEGVGVIINKGDSENEVIIESILTPKEKRKQGLAGKAIDKIVKSAQKNKVNLTLEAIPEEGSGISEEELITFYWGKGFDFEEGSNIGVRKDADSNWTADKKVKPLEQAEKDYDLTEDNLPDYDYDLKKALGLDAMKDYFRIGNVVIRIKSHKPNWSNFREDLDSDNNIKKVINVTIGDYRGSDKRLFSLEEMQDEYENVEFINIDIEDGESLSDNIKYLKTIIPLEPKTKPLPEAEKEVDTSPSEAQIEAGNYKKGHTTIQGMDITIENPKGSERSGTDEEGKKWKVKLKNSYGYFKRTLGRDGDQVDVFIGSDLESESAYIVDQVNTDGSFDEHKILVGFSDGMDAEKAYLSNYSKGWNGLGSITQIDIPELKEWLGTETRKSKPYNLPIKKKKTPKVVEGDQSLQSATTPSELQELLSQGKVKKDAAYDEKMEELRGGQVKFKGEDVTQTENFKNWFGDSKVVDEEGNPIVVYHGTGATIEKFSPSDERIRFKAKNPTDFETPKGNVKENLETTKTIAKDIGDKLGVKVNVVEYANDLPQHIKESFSKSGLSETYGVYSPTDGEVYLVAYNLEGDKKLIRETALHEVIGHKGFWHLLGSKGNPILDLIWKGMSKENQDTYFDENNVLDNNKNIDTKKTERLAAEEFMADTAGKGKIGGWLHNIIAKIREAFRKLFPNLRYNNNDILDLLRRSKENLKKEAKVVEGEVKLKAVDQTKTPEFKNWFGDSKVVDENGKPLVVYHGTTENFTEFDGGSFFTDDYMNADGYAGGENIIEAYLSIEKPLIIDAKGQNWDNLFTPYGKSTREIIGNVDEIKHDGVIFKNIKDNWSGEEEWGNIGNVYFTFNPTQIKSSTENIGTFDPESADIRFSAEKKPTRIEKKEAEIKAKISEFKRTTESITNHKKLKNKITALKAGYKMGILDERTSIKNVQKEIVNYAKKYMPLAEAGKRDVSKLLTMVKNTQKPSKLEEIFNKIDEMTTGINRKQTVNKIDEILKRAEVKKVAGKIQGKLSPSTQKIIDEIRVIRKLKNTDEYVDNIKVNDVESIALFSVFGNLKDKSRAEIDKAHAILNELVTTGKIWFKEEIARRKLKHDQIRDIAEDKITGGEGITSAQDLKAEGKEKIKNWYNNRFFNKNQSFEWLMDIISNDKTEKTGQGYLQDHFGDILNEATNKETKGHREYIELLNDKAAEIFGKEKSALASKLSENARQVEKSGVTYVKNGKRVELPLSQNEAYKKWMELQDPKLENTFLNMGWDQTTIEQLNNFIKPDVKKWAEWQLNEFYPEYYKTINEVYRRNYFVDLPFNEFYSPIKREVADVKDTDDPLLKNTRTLSGVGNASLKSRVSNNIPLAYKDGDNVLANHLAEMEHFKAWVEPMRELRSVFGSRTIQHALKFTHGSNIQNVINQQIDDFARGGIDRALVVSFIDKVRRNFVTAELGLNYGLLPKQLVSSFTYMADIPVADYMKGMANFASNPMKVINILRESELIKNRYKSGWTHEVESAMKSLAPEALAGTKTKFQQLRNVLMLPTKLGDRFAIFAGYPVYEYYYNKKIADGAPVETAKKYAMNKFERVASRSQQSAKLKDTSQLQKGSLGKLFTMFHNSQQQYFRYELAALRNLSKGRGNVLHNLKILGVTHFLLPVLFQLVSNAFTDEDEDKEIKRLWRAAILGSWNGLLIAGDIIEYGLEKMFGERWGYSPSPTFGSVENMGHGIGGIVKSFDDIDEDIFAEAIDNLDIGTMSEEVFNERFVKGADKFAHGVSQTALGVPYRPTKKIIKQVQEAVNPDLKLEREYKRDISDDLNAIKDYKEAVKKRKFEKALKISESPTYEKSKEVHFKNNIIKKWNKQIKDFDEDGKSESQIAELERLIERRNNLMKELIKLTKSK